MDSTGAVETNLCQIKITRNLCIYVRLSDEAILVLKVVFPVAKFGALMPSIIFSWFKYC